MFVIMIHVVILAVTSSKSLWLKLVSTILIAISFSSNWPRSPLGGMRGRIDGFSLLPKMKRDLKTIITTYYYYYVLLGDF